MEKWKNKKFKRPPFIQIVIDATLDTKYIDVLLIALM